MSRPTHKQHFNAKGIVHKLNKSYGSAISLCWTSVSPHTSLLRKYHIVFRKARNAHHYRTQRLSSTCAKKRTLLAITGQQSERQSTNMRKKHRYLIFCTYMKHTNHHIFLPNFTVKRLVVSHQHWNTLFHYVNNFSHTSLHFNRNGLTPTSRDVWRSDLARANRHRSINITVSSWKHFCK